MYRFTHFTLTCGPVEVEGWVEDEGGEQLADFDAVDGNGRNAYDHLDQHEFDAIIHRIWRFHDANTR